MPIERILMVHGVGDQEDEHFGDDWKREIIGAFPRLAGAVFQGLYWEDLRREAAAKWPPLGNGLATVLAEFGLPQLKEILAAPAYRLVESYAMDVLTYVGIPDATAYFQNGCYRKLQALTAGYERETLIIGHSLGSAMIPHMLWRMRQNTGSIPFHSLILLASPLGMASPIEWAIGDFLEVMGRLSGTDRAATLRSFALAWTRIGDRRLHFISNTNDIVCHDARFDLLGEIKDILPIRQGFDDEEVALLEDAHEGCHHQVTFGEQELGSIGGNHNAISYIRTQAFKDVLGGLLNA